MLKHLTTFGMRQGPPHLPQRRWRIRAPRAFVRGIIGAVAGAIVPFVMWWLLLTPLWLLAPCMAIGWAILMPRPLHLALDERGVALLVPSWTRDEYLWIPRDRLVRVEIRQGWLLATGTTIEQQGNLNWVETATAAGTMVPPWLQMSFKSGLGANQFAAPIHLLDQLARDEIELWLYQQGK